jgi:hypothetical protein
MSLPNRMKRDTTGSHCRAHIMHNSVQVTGRIRTEADVLVVNIYKYFHLEAIRII